MNFKKAKYKIVKKALSPELTRFCYNYLLNKRKVARLLFDTRWISPFTTEWGRWDDKQTPNTYSHYGDMAMETLLTTLKPKMEKETGYKLNETYAYARLYKKGDVLERHKDRFSCEISTTMHLGGDEWSIYLDPTNTETYDPNLPYKIIGSKGVRIDLKPGDMLVYRGRDLEHWRVKFKDKDCAQVFLHYNNEKTPGSSRNLFDKRPHLGLPGWFQK